MLSRRKKSMSKTLNGAKLIYLVSHVRMVFWLKELWSSV